MATAAATIANSNPVIETFNIYIQQISFFILLKGDYNG